MPLIFLCGFVAIALLSLVEHRFAHWGVAGPAALALAGAVLVFIDVGGFADAVAGDAAEHVVELILAVLLFVDACEVRGGVFGGEGRAVARLVLIALPLSLIAVVVAGAWMLPQLNVLVLIVIACVVMPTDFSPAAGLLRSPWIPPRLRQILNVESGYNDGLVSPVFAMALAAAVALPTLLAAADTDVLSPETEAQLEENIEEFLTAFLGAVPATLVAVLIGVVFGGLFGLLARLAITRGWAEASGIRYVMLLVRCSPSAPRRCRRSRRTASSRGSLPASSTASCARAGAALNTASTPSRTARCCSSKKWVRSRRISSGSCSGR